MDIQRLYRNGWDLRPFLIITFLFLTSLGAPAGAQRLNCEALLTQLTVAFGAERASRPPIEHIVAQAESLIQAVPELEGRVKAVWSEGEAFELKLSEPTSGLELKRPAWQEFLSTWERQLENGAASVLNITSPERDNFVRTTSNRIEKILASERRQGAYQELARDHDFKAIAHYLILALIRNPEVRAILTDTGSDSLNRFLLNLRQRLAEKLSGGEVPGELENWIVKISVPRLEIPPLTVREGHPAETELFRAATYVTRAGELAPLGRKSIDLQITPVRDRSFAMFKGVYSEDCVGGRCASFRSLTPERWATALIDGSYFYKVEQQGRYIGFVQIVPVEIRGKIYGSLEVGLSDYPEILPALLQELENQIPKSWRGLVIGESEAMSRAVMLRSIWSSPQYLLGEDVGTRKEVRFLDPLVEKIVRHSPIRGYALRYGGKMILDASIRGAGKLILLNKASMADLRHELERPEIIVRALGHGGRLAQGMISHLQTHFRGPDETAALWIAIQKAYRESRISAQVMAEFLETFAAGPIALKVEMDTALFIAGQKLRLQRKYGKPYAEGVNRLWNAYSWLPLNNF